MGGAGAPKADFLKRVVNVFLFPQLSLPRLRTSTNRWPESNFVTAFRALADAQLY